MTPSELVQCWGAVTDEEGNVRGSEKPDLNPDDVPSWLVRRLNRLDSRANRLENRQWGLLCGIVTTLLATLAELVLRGS